MTTSGQLIDIVSRALAVSRESVLVHTRNLREAEPSLITVKGRGRGAAAMTLHDASRVLIAVAASPATRESVETVKSFSHLMIPDRLFKREGLDPTTPKSFLLAVATRMEAIVAENDAGILSDQYRRLDMKESFEGMAALTFHSALGLDAKQFPKRAQLRWYPAGRNSSKPEELSFVPPGLAAGAREFSENVPLVAPSLMQARYVSFTAFAQIALSV